MAVEVRIPEAGESISEVQIGAWLKQVGDYVEQDEVLVEIETDKASMELPSPASGVVREMRYKTGDVVKVREVIAVVDETAQPAVAGADRGAATGNAPSAAAQAPSADEPRVMPAARRALADAGLEAQQVEATGPGGRLLKEDVQRHVARAQSAPPAAARPAPVSADAQAEEEVVPMTMLRRRIAQRLVESRATTAALTTFNEIDMTAVLELRKARNEAFQKKYGVKLGFMSFFVKAAIDALKHFPAVNGEIRGNDIVYKNYYHVGVAVSTEHGLVVPVIRHAEQLSFAEIEQAIGDLATRARDRQLAVEEMQGGTFTITNGGIFGSLLSTPIINPPQSAILGLHAINERPAAVNGQVVIRPLMYVALTYDHRIIDGRESVSFLKRVKECIEDPARMLIEI